MVAIGEDLGAVPPNWSIYFGVRDCDAAVAKSECLGGKILAPTMQVKGVGRLAHLQDRQVAVFAVIAHDRA